MSDDTKVIDLLERAVAEVPPTLLRPPHAAIRRLIRRRRATRLGAVAVTALAALAGFAAVRPGGTPPRPVPAAPAALPTVPGVPWHTARIDRTGTRITVYAMPLPGKCVELNPAGDRADRSGRAVSVFLAGVYTGCADDSAVAARTFELPQTVGDRAVLDARDPAGQRVVFRDAELPDLAGGWAEQPPVWQSPGGALLALRYTRQGGPEVRIYAFHCGCEARDRLPPDRTLSVDGHTVDLYDRPGSPAAGWWSERGQVRFQLVVAGRAVENSEFEQIVRGMTWS
ncbi:hypothetical protein [Dactylosporangium sp. NPDC005555]|uniref:hypothetical protein n=1 Tax=Dactylosporangium sp. NPDC005555 TaxID=3154889 RepID=UPI0033A9E92E